MNDVVDKMVKALDAVLEAVQSVDDRLTEHLDFQYTNNSCKMDIGIAKKEIEELKEQFGSKEEKETRTQTILSPKPTMHELAFLSKREYGEFMLLDTLEDKEHKLTIFSFT